MADDETAGVFLTQDEAFITQARIEEMEGLITGLRERAVALNAEVRRRGEHLAALSARLEELEAASTEPLT